MFTVALITSFAIIQHSVYTFNLSVGLFRRYEIQPWGCQIFSKPRAKIRCTVVCQSNPQFRMIGFETDCVLCYDSDISYLNFTSGHFYYFKEHACWHNITRGNQPLPVPLSQGIVIRWLVHLQSESRVVLSYSTAATSTIFTLTPRVVGNEVSLYFRIYRSGTNIGRNTDVNRQTTQVSVLVTLESYKVFLNNAFVADLPHTEPLSEAQQFLYISDYPLDYFCY